MFFIGITFLIFMLKLSDGKGFQPPNISKKSWNDRKITTVVLLDVLHCMLTHKII